MAVNLTKACLCFFFTVSLPHYTSVSLKHMIIPFPLFQELVGSFLSSPNRKQLRLNNVLQTFRSDICLYAILLVASKSVKISEIPFLWLEFECSGVLSLWYWSTRSSSPDNPGTVQTAVTSNIILISICLLFSKMWSWAEISAGREMSMHIICGHYLIVCRTETCC